MKTLRCVHYLQHMLMCGVVLVLSGCSYNAYHNPFPENPSQKDLSKKEVIIVMDNKTASMLDVKKDWFNDWKTDLGPALIEILPKIISREYATSAILITDNLELEFKNKIVITLKVKELKIDFATTFFGTNDCTLTVEGEISEGKKRSTYSVSGHGDGSGAYFIETYGLLFKSLDMGFTGKSKAISSMISECAADASLKILNKLKEENE